MRKALAVLILVISMAALSYAMGWPTPGSAPKTPTTVKSSPAAYPYLIDNFSSGTIDKAPVWFVFDNLIPTIVKSATLKGGDAAVEANNPPYALLLKGSAKDWYVGGMGTVLDLDTTPYDSFSIDVYGNGETSGILKIELYDDDNNNKDVEVDKIYVPMYDDLWSYEVKVDWKGWKHVSVPFHQFKASGNGNKVWDPSTKNGSAGLVKIQLICVAPAQTGSINYAIDNLELGTK